MSIKVRVGGSTRNGVNVRTFAGGLLRPAKRVRVMRTGGLATVFSIAEAIQAVASPSFVSGEESGTKPVRVASDSVMAVVSGGSAPYTYQWQVNDNRVDATSPSSATTAFATVLLNSTIETTAQCTVRDAFGAQAVCTCSVMLTVVSSS